MDLVEIKILKHFFAQEWIILFLISVKAQGFDENTD